MESPHGKDAHWTTNRDEASAHIEHDGLEARVHLQPQEGMGSPMIIGAAIAGLLIVSLFFEMISSSPKAHEEQPVRAKTVK